MVRSIAVAIVMSAVLFLAGVINANAHSYGPHHAGTKVVSYFVCLTPEPFHAFQKENFIESWQHEMQLATVVGQCAFMGGAREIEGDRMVEEWVNEAPKVGKWLFQIWEVQGDDGRLYYVLHSIDWIEA